jgi:hypothetical protein
MSLTIYFIEEHWIQEDLRLVDKTIAHKFVIDDKLKPIAEECGLYGILWHPKKFKIRKAYEMSLQLTIGISFLNLDIEANELFNLEEDLTLKKEFLSIASEIREYCHNHPYHILKTST